MEVQVLIVPVEPGVDGIGLAGGLALHDSTFALHQGGVDGLLGELGRDEDFHSNPTVLQLARRLDSSPASEVRVVLQAHLPDEHAVVLNHVLVICIGKWEIYYIFGTIEQV